MTLLFITQKLHQQDAFAVLWVRAFIARGYRVEVLCLEAPRQHYEFPVHSMGKERGASRLRQMLNFYRLILARDYDRVFIHMSPVWYALGWWVWLMRRKAAYLWYTHYKMQLGVRLFSWFGTRFFCATAQSLPQFEGSRKKIVTGHGIDLAFWPKRRSSCNDPHRLLMVHRLSRSKRVELVVETLLLLPPAYTLDIYGIVAEPDYMRELQTLVAHRKLAGRVTFHGTVPMDRLPQIYMRHRLLVNMASETIDKTMLEAMTCGCYPVTPRANAQAIGIAAAPADASPEAIAQFIRTCCEQQPLPAEEMYEIVAQRHSLAGLIARMDGYIRQGT